MEVAEIISINLNDKINSHIKILKKTKLYVKIYIRKESLYL